MKLDELEPRELDYETLLAAQAAGARIEHYAEHEMICRLGEYAKAGLAPQGFGIVRVDLFEAKSLIHHLDSPEHRAEVCDALAVMLTAVAARLAIDLGDTVGHEGLAVLAGLSRKGLWQAVQRGDAPQPMAEGRRRVYDPRDCRAWLMTRGVKGFE